MIRWEQLAIAGAAAYLIVLGVAMQQVSYDVWGALITVPVLVVLSVPLIRRALSGSLEPLRVWAWVGLFVKFAGAIGGYQIRFDSYGGNADAGRYDQVGKLLAADGRSGLLSPLDLIPTGRSTVFIEELTGLVYSVFGPSRLGGFMVFTWFSFIGLVFFVKAAAIAVPGLATRRYTIALFLFPSIVYWGSSIGKEAFVGMCLGMAAYGAALVFSRDHNNRNGTVYAALGMTGAAMVRPHFAAIWVGAIVIALFARMAVDLSSSAVGDDDRRRLRFGTVALAGVALIGFIVVASITLNYLDPPSNEEQVADAAISDRLTAIFEDVEERTGQGGSSFAPIVVNGPQDWPYAAYRTVTRPLIFEARTFAELLPAAEMTALVIVGLYSGRRLLNAPRLMLTTPYLVFALLCIGTFGVAFASIGNLGILVRQRSLVLPLLLLFFCLPAAQVTPPPGLEKERRRRPRKPDRWADRLASAAR